MSRLLFTIGVAVSAVLAVGICMLWWPSYMESREVSWVMEVEGGRRRVAAGVMVTSGAVEVWARRFDPGAAKPPLAEEDFPGPHYELDVPWQRSCPPLGFGTGWYVNRPGDARLWMHAPLWAVAALLASPLAVWLRRICRRQGGGLQVP